jgi:hypothetical protein
MGIAIRLTQTGGPDVLNVDRIAGITYYGDSLLFRMREWRVGRPLVPPGALLIQHRQARR